MTMVLTVRDQRPIPQLPPGVYTPALLEHRGERFVPVSLPCRTFAPVFEAASQQHPDITFGKVDTEAQPELAGAARIMSIATLMAFRDGILVFSQPGALPAVALEQVIQAVRDQDMDDVRRQIAEQRDTRSA